MRPWNDRHDCKGAEEIAELDVEDGIHSRQDEEKMALSGRRGLRDDLSVGWDDIPCVRYLLWGRPYP